MNTAQRALKVATADELDFRMGQWTQSQGLRSRLLAEARRAEAEE
jgi:hypothetical protein